MNNAGVATVTGGILNESPEVWNATMATHLDATFLLSKYAATSMLKRKRGKIINLASMYSFFGAGMFPSYGGHMQVVNGGVVSRLPWAAQSEPCPQLG